MSVDRFFPQELKSAKTQSSLCLYRDASASQDRVKMLAGKNESLGRKEYLPLVPI